MLPGRQVRPRDCCLGLLGFPCFFRGGVHWDPCWTLFLRPRSRPLPSPRVSCFPGGGGLEGDPGVRGVEVIESVEAEGITVDSRSYLVTTHRGQVFRGRQPDSASGRRLPLAPLSGVRCDVSYPVGDRPEGRR